MENHTGAVHVDINGIHFQLPEDAHNAAKFGKTRNVSLMQVDAVRGVRTLIGMMVSMRSFKH
jgi:hypothetical protein